ncbi:putative alpha-1,3-glucanase/mutanase [Sclerotinia borealis F-4128]|uniref:Putative alpha-1,3-glucanase/mutanase n=1 Tax=Sclerotinia borealis (strain F-4128) TaxID=1432307 RepID=W9CBH1_SCLBF|nr:putative alpha-1,3-glucanase/mutanase [Sclerotinia borealis F-4128]
MVSTTAFWKAILLIFSATFAIAAPTSYDSIGIVGERVGPQDFDADMQRAKSLGIDAFALNIGVDPYTDTQLGFAYQSAANNGMKVFISFDFNWWNPSSQATQIGQMIAKYAALPAQLFVNGKAFASSFAGDQLDIAALRAGAGIPIFFAPNFHPEMGTNFGTIDGALNWMAWPNDGNNKAPIPGANVTVEAGDAAYIKALAGKPYIAPVSPWFSTHFGPEVPYSKNWIFPSDLLWFDRWNEILTLGPQYIEIVTWNDYGESHYIGPLNSLHFDDGNSKWVNDMPHDGWLDMAKPFIAAYHAGASSPNKYITSDQLIYWYRPALRTLDCDATDTTMVPASNGSGNYFQGRPNGWQDMQDSVFVVAMLKAPGIVTVMSGNNVQQFNAPAGASAYQVDMQVGKQQFFLQRGTQILLQAVSLHDVADVCICGIYNFNAYVGTVPDGPSDPLLHDGLASLTAGLHVSTCSASPSLPTAPIKPTTTPPGGGTVVPPITTKPPTTTPPTTTPPTTTPPTTTPPTTTKPTTTTTTSTTSTTSSVPSGTCVAGTGPGNYVGLCSFTCDFGYCPAPCTCSSYAATGNAAPPVTNTPGYPLAGEDSTTYSGLCNFTCNHGYCPPTACTYNSNGSPISSSSSTTPSAPTTTTKPTTTTSTSTTTTSTTSSAPSGTAFCVAGTAPGNYIGLCNFCCQYNYCPPGPCTCTSYANTPIPAPPASSPSGKPLYGEDDSYLGLCNFACGHGYCPGTACASG